MKKLPPPKSEVYDEGKSPIDGTWLGVERSEVPIFSSKVPKSLPTIDITRCNCVVKNREPNETQREWFKRWMCMFHWMQTDYYQAKLDAPDWTPEGQ